MEDYKVGEKSGSMELAYKFGFISPPPSIHNSIAKHFTSRVAR